MPEIDIKQLDDNLATVVVKRGELEIEFGYRTELYTKKNAPQLVAIDYDPVVNAERKKLVAQKNIDDMKARVAATKKAPARRAKAEEPAQEESLEAQMDAVIEQGRQSLIDVENARIDALAKKLSVLCGKTNLTADGQPAPTTAQWFSDNLSEGLMEEAITKIVQAIQGPLVNTSTASS